VTELLEVFLWRLAWWAVRILWLPFVAVAFAYYIAWPAIGMVAEALLTPSGLLVGVLVLLWMRPSVLRRGGRHHR
jgi:hypothetical protein